MNNVFEKMMCNATIMTSLESSIGEKLTDLRAPYTTGACGYILVPALAGFSEHVTVVRLCVCPL